MKPKESRRSNNIPKNEVFGLGPNMCFINYNHPRTLPMSQCEVKKLIKDGNVQSLEEKLLNGEGYKLIGHYSTNPKIKTFLQSVPIYIARIDMLQDSACKGNLRDMQVLLMNGNSTRNIYKITPAKLVCCKDLNGVTVLHKVVYYDFLDIVEWLVKSYPQTVHIKDKTLRIPLHYICSCSDVSRIWDLMLEVGADPNALDINNKTPSYYLEYSENISLPNNSKSDCTDEDAPIKPSNIRIWIHERNIKQLSKVIWSGLGDKLLTETSKQIMVNKFLKAVPYIMGIIKEIHRAVIDDNISLLKKLNRDPVPIEVLASKDQNGLTPLHKAVGLGRLSIVDYIIFKNSKTVNIRDNDGRTPLHYVFIGPSKNITPIYNRLIKAGANENLIDKNGKTPKSDGGKINDIPMDLLTFLPKAPRVASEFPASWDWNILYNDKLLEKSKLKNILSEDSKTQIRSSTSTIKTNTNSISDTEQINNIKNVDAIDDTNDIEDIDNIDNILDSRNKEVNDPKPEYSDEKYIPVNTQRDLQDINDNIDNVDINKNKENKENYDPDYYKDKKYISLYNNQQEMEDIDDLNDFISKPNSYTLGEVRQALNNGLLDDILPMNGPVYRVNSLRDENIVPFDNKVEPSESQEFKSSAQILVKEGSLDKIADYILDGKHEKLKDLKSDMPEVQGFLDKIPFYVNKIDQIHYYCAVGDLDKLVQILDRRKFCLARESKSGLGLTPLHTAALYEQLYVFGYLAAKFPETLKLTDFHGRTPMDYVTSIPDNTFQDKLLDPECYFGEFLTDYYMPQNFKNNGVTIKPEKIRKALGYVMEVVNDETSDTDPDRSYNSSGKLLSAVMSTNRFSIEDREYLIKAIGKPLTSGLKELIKRRPSNPALYLAEHLTNHYDDPQSDPESGVIELETKDLTQNVLNDDQCNKIVEHTTKSWEIFSKYQPEFKVVSRDEFGMSMIHYAASRTHNRHAFFQLLQEQDVNIGLRDENYRTARDIAVSSFIKENVKTIDTNVVYIIARGEYNKVIQLLLEGYNHILDLDTDKDIFKLSSSRGHPHILTVLQSITTFEEKRDRLHTTIRLGAYSQVKQMLQEEDDECIMLTIAKNEQSRCSLHIAVLRQNEEIVRFLSEHYSTTLNVLDNIERTALHYAMAIDKVEAISTILIECGAKRVAKDLKGRQPSYYFMNKFDIRKLMKDENELQM